MALASNHFSWNDLTIFKKPVLSKIITTLISNYQKEPKKTIYLYLS